MPSLSSTRRKRRCTPSWARFIAKVFHADPLTCSQLLPDLERGCAEGRANACDYARWLYAEGRGMPKDLARGVTKDEAQGMAALGALCTDKFFVACTRLAVLRAAKPAPKDRARAKELLAQACEGGDAQACGLAKSLPR